MRSAPGEEAREAVLIEGGMDDSTALSASSKTCPDHDLAPLPPKTFWPHHYLPCIHWLHYFICYLLLHATGPAKISLCEMAVRIAGSCCWSLLLAVLSSSQSCQTLMRQPGQPRAPMRSSTPPAVAKLQHRLPGAELDPDPVPTRKGWLFFVWSCLHIELDE